MVKRFETVPLEPQQPESTPGFSKSVVRVHRVRHHLYPVGPSWLGGQLGAGLEAILKKYGAPARRRK